MNAVMLKHWSVRALVVLILSGAACNTSPTAPSTAPPGSLPGTAAFACPAGVSQASLDGGPVHVNYPLPTVGGQTADKVTCSPAPGSLFPVNATTMVTCQASEAPTVVAPCSFAVAVTIQPRLSRTTFLAFGDSITTGFVHPYPSQLEQMLRERYSTQGVTVVNRGVGGERTGQGRLRIVSELNSVRPDVVLLLEGVNDILLALFLQSPIPISSTANNLRDMVDAAQTRGVDVLLATLTPVTDDLELREPGAQAAIEALNAEIRRIAADRGLGPVVDLHGALINNPSSFLADGLHPDGFGNQRIAQAFYDAIVSRFDVTPEPRP